jgi:hypothetical protein
MRTPPWAAAAVPYQSRHMRAHAHPAMGGGGGMDGLGLRDLMLVHPNSYQGAMGGGGGGMDPSGLVMAGVPSVGEPMGGGGGGSSQLQLVQALRQQTAAQLRGAQLLGNVAVAEVLRQQMDLLAQVHDNEVMLSGINAEGGGGGFKAQMGVQQPQQQQQQQVQMLQQGNAGLQMSQVGN